MAQRVTSLIVTFLFLVVFIIVCYYGIQLTFVSALVLSLLFSLILLLILHSIGQVATEPSDFSLIIYGIYVTLVVIVVILYVIFMALNDVRMER